MTTRFYLQCIPETLSYNVNNVRNVTLSSFKNKVLNMTTSSSSRETSLLFTLQFVALLLRQQLAGFPSGMCPLGRHPLELMGWDSLDEVGLVYSVFAGRSETPWRRHAGANPNEHQHDGRKPTETYATEFCYKKREFISQGTQKHKIITLIIISLS